VKHDATTAPRTALSNATILTLGAAAETVLQFLFLIIAGRQLGPAEFGFYGYLLSIVTFAVAAAQFGLTVIGVRELAQRPQEETSILAGIFRIRATISAAMFVAAVIAAMMTPDSATHSAAVWLMFAYMLAIPFDPSLLFDARKLSRWDVPGRLAGRFVSLGLLAVLWRVRGTVTVADVALCSSVLMIVNVAVGWRIGRKLRLPLHWLVKTTETWKLVRASAPVLWSNIMTIAYMQSPVILLKWFSTADETGFFTLANRLMMPILVFRGVLYRVMLPLVSEAALDKEKLTNRLERLFPALALVFMPSVAFAIPAAEVLLVPLFGAEYSGAVVPFQITVSVLMLTGMGALFGTSVLAAGDARTPTIGLTWGCLAGLGFAALTVSSLGATGAAWATFVGEIVSSSYVIPRFLRLSRPKILGRLVRIAAASLMGTAIYYVLRDLFSVTGVIALMGALIVMLAGLWLAGEITPSRLQALRSLLQKPTVAAPVEETANL
jgi:O-antigen/teichoic acid export membrane protein